MAARWASPLIVGVALAAAGLSVGAEAKKAATALEASFKDRITAKIGASLEAAVQHLTRRLAHEAPTFSGYEYELDSTAEDVPMWRKACAQVEPNRDSIENCALRQLHALAAFCDGASNLKDPRTAERRLVDNHLKALTSKKEVANLGMKLNKFDGVDIWFHRKTPGSSSDDVDASPSLQASALMALVRCADATGQKHFLVEADSWFEGLQKVYPQKIWNSTLVSFHKSGIIWESLALVLSHVPPASRFHGKLLAYVKDFEAFLYRVWEENPETWSFSSARALALRWKSKALKGKSKKVVKTWAQEHVERFLGVPAGRKQAANSIEKGILAKMGGLGYTCGPLQGLTSLAAVVGEAELVQVVLKLLEKDIDRYQLTEANPGPQKVLLRAGQRNLQGAFFRDDQQMKLEKRTSLRVDDVVQCMVAMTQALKMLDDIQGVVVDAPQEAQSTKDASKEESKDAGEDADVPKVKEGRESEL